ncbi:MAG: hypothetical protein NC548_28355 [Lachnospiraceae bacterium]|nr:hypothetical protein [Lachnospiraceae bacterium]MCM1232002.1 hypothetical protein [Ruminococcus flavefaciens]
MAMNNNQQKPGFTTTQIRNLYSDASYLNIKFYNANLSFSFSPFQSKNANGLNVYDMKNNQLTTVNYEGAYALYEVCKDILEEKTQSVHLEIPCSGNAILILERKAGQNGQMETTFSISKNNVTIPFVFATTIKQEIVNGQQTTKVIETGLGVFKMTIEGYLTGINADRHLDKLTDDFAKSQGGQGQQGQQNGFRPNNGYRKQYPQQQGGQPFRKPYQPSQSQQQSWGGGRQQDMSSYEIKN